LKLDLKLRALISLLLVGAAFYMLFPPLDPDGDGPKKGRLNLGLDLQGGMHMVMDVRTDEAVVAELVRMKSSFENQLRRDKVKNYKVEVAEKERAIVFTFDNPDDRKNLESQFRDEASFHVTTAAESEAFQLIATMQPARTQQIKETALDQALMTIRNRIDELGVSEPIVQQQQSLTEGALPRILVQLPGIRDVRRAKDIIGRTALLEFRIVIDGPMLEQELLDSHGGRVPSNAKLFEDSEHRKAGEPLKYMLQKDAEVTGADLQSVRVDKDDMGKWAVAFELNRAGSKKFADLTQANIDKRLAIVLDGKVQSAPVIRDRISRNGQISGNFSFEEAKDLSIVLRSGALPASVVPVEERTVGPSLGNDSIARGIKSMLIGALLVVAFMIVWYKTSGVLADLGVVCTLILLLGSLASLHATLTMPGIAGIVLTIGMAVDANVLIYERVREELRQGKSTRTAVANGYGRAFITIFDSNITTLIAAIALLQFGIGPIRGFAITLSIGIVSSMIAQIFIVHVLMDAILTRKTINKVSI